MSFCPRINNLNFRYCGYNHEMKIAISACLSGRKCRYNSEDKFRENVMNRFSNDEIILFCPEENVFGTPREPINIIGNKLMKNDLEITSLIEKEASEIILKNPDIVVLKSKSPSCALKTAKYYDENKNLISETGIGIFTKVLVNSLTDTKFYEENDL